MPPSPHLLGEQGDERFTRQLPSNLFGRVPGHLAHLLRELPGRVVARLRRHVFDRPSRVLQIRVRTEQPCRHHQRPRREDPGWLEISIQRAEVHPRRRGDVLSVLETRRRSEQLIDRADHHDRQT
jgi:hypothetical protein